MQANQKELRKNGAMFNLNFLVTQSLEEMYFGSVSGNLLHEYSGVLQMSTSANIAVRDFGKSAKLTNNHMAAYICYIKRSDMVVTSYTCNNELF